jgi:hypothetical protein
LYKSANVLSVSCESAGFPGQACRSPPRCVAGRTNLFGERKHIGEEPGGNESLGINAAVFSLPLCGLEQRREDGKVAKEERN